MHEEISLQLSFFFPVPTPRQLVVIVCFLFYPRLYTVNKRYNICHLSGVSVDQMEDCCMLRLPGHDFAKALPLYFVQHELQQIYLDWLLDKHNIVLRHD